MRPVTIARFVSLFTLFSLVPLALAIAGGEPRDGESLRMLKVVVDGVPQPVLGLMYEGTAGQTQVLAQLALVLASLAAALLADGLAQRTGVIVLACWAALWTFNAGQAAVATGLYGFWGAFILTGLWLTLALLWLAQLCLPHSHAARHSPATLA